MLPLALSLVLAAAPTAQQARSLAARGAWDELYLGFASARPESYPPAERSTIGRALLQGCETQLKPDAVLAYSLAEGARRFLPEAPTWLCLARAALATEQRGAAEEALREGHGRLPREGALALALGRLLLEDQQPEEAATVLARVERSSREHTEAQALLARARAQRTEEQAARRQAEALEQRWQGGETQPAGGPARRKAATGARQEAEAAPASGSLSYASGVGPGGLRTRANSRFVIKYFNNARDFGQRAEYEGQVVEALEEAAAHTRRILGEAREGPVDVILYTREEFAAHMGARAARAVAGLYSLDAIRINDAAELSRQTRATLVHEYVHAAVDEFCGGRAGAVPTWLNEGLAEYVEWRYLGADAPPHSLQVALRGAARAQALPKLADLERGALLGRSDPALAYATSAVAVRQLVRRAGTHAVLALLREVGGGASFAEALRRHFGMEVSALDAEVHSALSAR